MALPARRVQDPPIWHLSYLTACGGCPRRSVTKSQHGPRAEESLRRRSGFGGNRYNHADPVDLCTRKKGVAIAELMFSMRNALFDQNKVLRASRRTGQAAGAR